jgi:type IV pilus assembly protein PilM
VRRAIVHPLPVGLVVDGEVVNADELAVELRALFTEHKLPHDVRVGLAHPRLMVRMVELPASLAGRELDGAVRHLAGDLLPVGLDQLVVDYRRVGKAPEGNGPPQQRVLMAAARIDGIDRLIRALSAAHLKAECIQLSGLAMLRALEHPPLAGQAILYVQAGALTNVVIAEDGEPLLVRAASAGSEAIAQGLAERTQMSHEQARAHIAALGVGNAPYHGAPAAVSPEIEAAVSLQVREGLRRVIAEIQSSRGFYSARPDARQIGGVVLTGAMTTWPGVAELLRDELNLPVLPAGRDNWPDLGTVAVAPERLDVAVGLALAAQDDRPDLSPARINPAKQVDLAPNARVAQVVCGVAAVLAAAIVYMVMVSNQISSGKQRLVAISGELAQTETEAAKLKPYANFAQTALERREAVTKVAKARFDWDKMLIELARVAPGDVWLTTAKGTVSSTSTVEGGGGGSSQRASYSGPALELAGCGKREKDVPKYMKRLYTITGVNEVGFDRTEKSGGAGAEGSCSNVATASSFTLVTYFDQSPELAALAAEAGGSGTAAPVAAAPPVATTPPAAANPTPTGGTK